ncbi:hypothetical protein IBL26_01125 [Roseomonas aerophila]|uniref:Uncharacterized protein n=1 Tax=Teichococcus aerophilus TaxID=1224513 RepID=A0ABR7RH40_9PROT|nr:hypothetical protein [Pseudoroseomonas aerophila]MBC9205420.1 hypothetical protein [Pseudoroseomonas aerophila]
MMLLARASAGLIFWAFGFSVLYGLHGIGCAYGWPSTEVGGGNLFRWVMVASWLLLCAGGAALIWLAKAAPSGLERRLSLTSAVVGCAATFVTGLPVAVTSACV